MKWVSVCEGAPRIGAEVLVLSMDGEYYLAALTGDGWEETTNLQPIQVRYWAKIEPPEDV